MALFVIADLHLGKDMAIFGLAWENHRDRLADNWCRVVKPADTVFILGDISWGMRLEDALPDLEFVKSLPGAKRILKGNHDYWWQTEKKMKESILDERLSILKPEVIEGEAVCGTRGWLTPGHPLYNKETDGRVFRRETLRLEMALEALGKINKGGSMRVMMHFPPAFRNEINEMIKIMRSYPVTSCYYGHLHGVEQERALAGEEWGIDFRLVSADHVRFTPVKISE